MQALRNLTFWRGPADRIARDERGTTAIEYALIATLIAVAMIAGAKALGESNSGSWGETANKVVNALQ